MTITSAMRYNTIFVSILFICVFATNVSANKFDTNEKATDSFQHLPVVTTSKKDNIYYVHAVMDVSFTPHEFLTLVNASDTDCSWIAHCRTVKILSKKDNVQIIRTELDVKWPFKNRDMVVLTVFNLNEDGLSIRLSDQSTYTDIDKKFVRITDVTGEWKMIKKSTAYYSLSYRGSASPNGIIPDWFAVNYLAESTEKTFNAVKERLDKNKNYER